MVKLEILAILILISLLIAPRVYLLVKNEYCLQWDCAFYSHYLKEKPSLSSSFPTFFWFVLMGPAASVFGEILAIKLFMFLSFIVFLFGIYLLSKKLKFKTATIFLILIMASLIPSFTRIWGDLYRNFLVLAILPYFLYFFLDSRTKFRIVSIVLFGIMLITHNTSWLLFPLIFIYILFLEKRTIQNILSLFVMFILLIFSLYGASVLISALAETPPSYSLTWPSSFLSFYPQTLYLFFFNSFIFIIGFMGFFYVKKKNPYHLFFLLFFIELFILSFILPEYTFNRPLLMLGFPAIILTALVIDKVLWKKKISGKVYILFTFIIIFALQGAQFLFGQTQFIDSEEADFFKTIDEEYPDNIVILTVDRTYYWLKYFTNKTIENTDSYALGENIPHTNQSIIYNEPDQLLYENAKKTIMDEYNVSEIHVYWNKDRDRSVNHTIIIERVNLLYNIEDVYFGVI